MKKKEVKIQDKQFVRARMESATAARAQHRSGLLAPFVRT